ncbi:hypothetical protein OPQ81_012033 [Rhizoctonia solani]|nr:hypothetical protein OPQ81_012033 [Rhizoctonia solani]
MSHAHLLFHGPYGIDSFSIFRPVLHGGGAEARAKEQLGPMACLAKLDYQSHPPNGFYEISGWYDNGYLHVTNQAVFGVALSYWRSRVQYGD